MDALKTELAKAGVRPEPEADITPDPFAALKRVPVKRLIARMGLSEFDASAPLTETDYKPERVRLPLKQHVGKPSVPVVKTGDIVRCGDLIAEIPERSLGARIHASIGGKVVNINDGMIEIAGGETA